MKIINAIALSLIVTVASITTACSSGSSKPSTDTQLTGQTKSNVVNGYYLRSESIVATRTNNGDLDYTESFEFALNNGENSISYSRFRNSMPESEHRLTFLGNGSPDVLTLVRDNGSTVTWQANTYNDADLLLENERDNSSYIFTYDGDKPITRQHFISGRLVVEASMIYDTSGNLITINTLFYPRDEPAVDSTRCNLSYSGELRKSYQCEQYDVTSDSWSLRKEGNYEHDDAGNRIRATVVTSGSLINGTLETTYEYGQTDRDVPNLILYNEIYFPANVL